MRPPDPQLTPDSWRAHWLERVEKCPMVLAEWMAHQHKDAYWRHGSVNEDYAQVTCPALVVCGWADGYSNAALRMAAGLGADSRTWIGPWAHTYPHLAQPGPQGGFLQEALAWWDRWLKGKATRGEHLPRIRTWLQDAAPPATSYAHRSGRWLALDSWPPRQAIAHSWQLQPGRLDTETGGESVISVSTPLANGINGPEWLPHGVGPELPGDQNDEDAGSLCFDSDALDTELVLCGTPTLALKIRTDTTQGLFQARLCDVFPDGSAAQISYGLLNLAHRKGLDRPASLTPGEWTELRLPLNGIAQRVPAGHRLRLSLSTQAWPLAWPAPRNMTLELMTGASRLEIATLTPGQCDDLATSVAHEAEIPPPLELAWRRPVMRERVVARNSENDSVTRIYVKDDGDFQITEHGMGIDAYGELVYHCRGEDPLSARAEYHYRIGFDRDDWQVGVECDVEVSADLENFYIRGEYRALEDGKVIQRRVVDIPVKRRYV
jgi:predicted acyl esterase